MTTKPQNQVVFTEGASLRGDALRACHTFGPMLD
jgi:hypothetical protein